MDDDVAAVKAFTADTPQSDDITAMAVRMVSDFSSSIQMQITLVAGRRFEPAAEPAGYSLNQVMYSLFPSSHSLSIV